MRRRSPKPPTRAGGPFVTLPTSSLDCRGSNSTDCWIQNRNWNHAREAWDHGAHSATKPKPKMQPRNTLNTQKEKELDGDGNLPSGGGHAKGESIGLST